MKTRRQKEAEKNEERDNERSRSRSREREKRDKHKHQSHRHKEKEREKEKDKDKETSMRKRRHESNEDQNEVKNKKDRKEKGKRDKDDEVDDDRRQDGKNERSRDEIEKERDETCNLTLSIEDTNQLRAKLGLKPLQVDDETCNADEESKEGEVKEIPKPKEVFIKTENISEKVKAEKIKERIMNHREKRRIQEKLNRVKGLAEESDEEDGDTSAWVEKNRKIQEEKERAAKRAKMLEEMDEEFGVTDIVEQEMKKAKDRAYSAKDLKGLIVGHKEDAFKEGHQVILTLKDKDVLAEDDDVLENVNIADEERTTKNLENKAKRPEYKPYDEPEFDEFGILKPKSLLSKYDEEIEGQKKETFKLGVDKSSREKELEMIRMRLKQQEGKVSLDLPQLRIASEYYTPDEMTKFKKPKKVKKVLRKKPSLAEYKLDEIETTTSVLSTSTHDHGSRSKKAKNTDSIPIDDQPQTSNTSSSSVSLKPNLFEKMNFDFDEPEIVGPDDDLTGIQLEEDEAENELQLALQKTRKLKQREETASTSATSILRIAEQVRQRSQVDMQVDDEEEDVLNTLPKVGANITLNSTAEFCRNLGDIPTYGLSGNRDDDEDMAELERELEEERKQKDEAAKGAWNEVEMDDDSDVAMEKSEPILEEEPDLSYGLGGALKLAMKKGYLDKDLKQQKSASRQSMLQAQSYTIEEKFYDDDKAGRRERYSGPVSEFRDKEGYKPEINLEYVSEDGRVIDSKEAFRSLSHRFHGKGPGKNKIDKRMKKLQQESKLRQMSSIDTPLNTLKLLQEKQKETQSAFVVLTGGQKTLPSISKTKK